MIFRVKKGHVGADLGTFQQAHVAKTIVFTMCLLILEMLHLHLQNEQNGPDSRPRWLGMEQSWSR